MNDFNRTELEGLKARVDLAELMRLAGLELKPVGKNLLARCPWHDDSEASLVVNPAKQLYNCFGCEAKGDVLSFLQVQEKLSFPEAVQRLKDLAGESSPDKPVTPKSRFEGGLTRDQLLDRVSKHYQQAFERSSEAKDYLRERKLWDLQLYEGFRVGFCDGSLLKTLPGSGPVREALLELGILNEKGREHFLGCLVVPLSHPTEGWVGMYGRRLNPKAKVRHLFLPGPKRGVFGLGTLEGAEFVYLAEGVIDAMSLWLAGLRPVSCAHGSNRLSPDLESFLRRSGVREIRVCFDSDRAGTEGVLHLSEQLGDRFQISRVLLPDGLDPNDILVREGPEVLRSFANCLQPVTEDPQSQSEEEVPLTQTSDQGFSLAYADVRYEVTPRPPYTGRLKIAIRGERQVSENRSAKYLDRCDLVSSRSRSETLRGMSQQLALDRERAQRHLREILDTTEEWVAALGPAGDKSSEVPELTDSEKIEALEFLRDPGLVDRLQADMEAFGYIGEERGKLLLYLVGLSRKLENPLSAIIRSQSGAGKSGMAHLVASMTPPEDVIHYSRVSPQALAYAEKDAYKRKLLLMEERVGGESADYYIRVLQSSHVIRTAVTIKDPVTGQMRNQEFEVEGPIAYIETTTDSRINQENASRCFEIFLDESEEQTRKIQERQRLHREAIRLTLVDREEILSRHHNAQRMLEEVKVVIPYVRRLSFPTRWLRTRRDNERFLCLIEASAFLHQHQREKKTVKGPRGNEICYVEATLEDYRLAYELAKDVLRDTLHELSISARDLLTTAQSLKETPFTRRTLREANNWSQRRIHEALHELVDMEYLAVTNTSGRAHQYSVVVGGPERASPVSCLTHPDELARSLSNPDP